MVPSVKPITRTTSQNGYKSSEVEVDRTEFAHKVSGKPEDEEETERSSSFADTDSDIENLESDSEVVSYFHHDLALGFDDLRRKKLTLQWRTFIQPVMWRCKWLELQVNRCNAQALKYDNEIAAYDAKYHPPSDNLNQEGSCVNSSPEVKMMLRKKRRKIEEAEDITSYMSNHNLFSYEGKQSRAANGARVDIDLGIQENINVDHEDEFVDTSWLQLEDGNVLLENMLRKLDFLQSKVKNLRRRMNKVTSKNAERLSLADELDVLLASTNVLSSPVRSPGSSPTIGGGQAELPSQNGNGGGGVGLTGGGCAGSSSGNAAADGQSGLMVKEMNVKDENMEEDVNDIEEDKIVLKESDLGNGDQPVHRTRSVTKITAPKGKKKRVKRRGSSSRWSRR